MAGGGTQPDREKKYNRKYWEAIEKNLSKKEKELGGPKKPPIGNWKPVNKGNKGR